MYNNITKNNGIILGTWVPQGFSQYSVLVWGYREFKTAPQAKICGKNRL